MSGEYPLTTRTEKWYPGPGRITIALPEGEPFMTIVTAMRFEDRIVFVADTQVTEDIMRTRTTKLAKHPILPLCWGYAGVLTVGESFTRWLIKQDTLSNWESLTSQVCTVLPQLNGDHKQRMKDSKSKWTKGDETWILMGGYLSGIPQILELAPTGEWRNRTEDNFAAIGSGAIYARLARFAIGGYLRDYLKGKGGTFPYTLGMLKFLTGFAAEYDRNSSGPLNTMEITNA